MNNKPNMKRFLLSLAALLLLAGCVNGVAEKAANPYDKGTEIIVKATGEVKNAATDDEVADIFQKVLDSLGTLQDSPEWQECIEGLEKNDTLLIQELKASQAEYQEALNIFYDAVLEATAK